MSRPLYEYECKRTFKDFEELENYDLCLQPGEVWLTTEPCKLTWLEAIEIAASNSNIRLPDYADIIRAVERSRENPELQEQFHPLEEGEFWAIGSENYEANQGFASCVTSSHDSYESHHSKLRKKWVRFIKCGAPESKEQVQKKKEQRDKSINEARLHKKSVDILELDTPEGRHNLELYIEFEKSDIRRRR